MIRKLTLVMLSAFIFFAFAGASLAGGYDDVPCDHWAYNAVKYLYSKGVLIGDEWGMFNGDDALSRYEFAVAIARIMEVIEDIEASGGTYDDDGDIRELSEDIHAIVGELEGEFERELDSLRGMLAVQGSKISTLEDKVADVTEDVDEMSGKLGNIPKFKFKGDVRLRFEGKYYSGDKKKHRPRMRFRLSLEAPINEEFQFKGRLASGSSSGPTSTNQTLEDEFDKKQLWIDRAYLEWKPGNMPGWKLMGGKFSPNWEKTLITIDSDVNVEGIAQSYVSDDGFAVNLAELVPDEKGFYIVAQVGKEDLLTDGFDAYITYHFINDQAWQFIENKLKDGDLKNRFKFDRIDMDNYSALDVIGQYAHNTGTTPVVLTCNYVRNLADDGQEGLSGLQQAAYANLKIGKAKELGDVEGWVEWGKLQANSVLCFLTDADRGSSDHEFYGGGLKYKWMKNLDIALNFIYADRLSKDENYKIIQLDLLSKF